MISVIQTVGSLAPETGGPARSVPHLSLALAEEGMEVTLLSIDLGSRFSAPLVPIHPLLNTVIVPARFSLGMRTVLVPEFRKALEGIYNDKGNFILHDHGIWLPQNGITAQIAAKYQIPFVISPRGMLEPWSLQFHRWRKLVAWHLYQKRFLNNASVIHATSDYEAQNINQLGLNPPIAVVPNGTELPKSPLVHSAKSTPKRRLLFISRIHPKKGLLNLIQAMSLLSLDDWELVIAGYDEGNYRQEIESAVKKEGLENVVSFYGPVGDQEKWELYASSDLFVLPSLSENFGIVVAEALAAGITVITTTETPWEDLKRYNCGWWVEPTVDNLLEALRDATALSDEKRSEMGEKGRKLVETKYTWRVVARDMISIYKDLVDYSPAPGRLFFSSD